MGSNTTKQRVIDAASSLFFQKGFHGTSVRDIANAASVNVSLISYYFKGKQGLLENAVTQYYEGYLETIETVISNNENETTLEQLKKVVFHIIQYKQRNHQFSCFIQRELSMDSVFVREMSVTYLAKENYLLKMLFASVVGKNVSNSQFHYLFMQFKGMLVTPYLLPHEWRNSIGNDSREQFIQAYTKTIHDWLNYLLSMESENLVEKK